LAVVSLLDEFSPAWQFHEIHRIAVAAPSHRAYDAVRDVTAGEIRWFRALTWLRRLGRPGPESILNAPAETPILEVATRTGFLLLAATSGEVVVGTVVIAPRGSRRPTTPDEYRSLDAPGYAKATMNFRIEAVDPHRCVVTTETRVYATDPRTRRRFGAYWFVIRPGSGLIRRMWLRAIKRRAEAQERHAPRRRRSSTS
jgi:hypothetical protein